ncbi:MmcQ/YjbR family DNA-binding protein [Marinimicrobium sp. ARAG 43.8]|uniref:MmcQ/YjbR family DNA-binding protein n=1 Tax=Marinimicrobium sp. ARAG 43.8 TaxID=3418719 RepID=UPI003CF2895D
MDYESAKASILAKPEAVELQAQGSEVKSFKVCHKLFATLAEGEDGVPYINLKCEPNRAQELRDSYPAIQPGHRMNKVHWNTVVLDGSVPEELVLELINHSYERVVENLPTADQERLLGR